MKKYEKTYDWVWNEKKGDYVKKYRWIETPEESMVPERIGNAVTDLVIVAVIVGAVIKWDSIANFFNNSAFFQNPFVIGVVIALDLLLGVPILLFTGYIAYIIGAEMVKAFKRDILGIDAEEEEEE